MPLGPQFRRKVREGARPALAAFAAVFLAAAIYSFTRPKIYEATASVVGFESLFKHGWSTQHSVSIDPSLDPPDEKARTIQRIAESVLFLTRVSATIEGTPLANALLTDSPQGSLKDALLKGRVARYSVETYTLEISFRSSAPTLSAEVATRFAGQMKGWLDKVRMEEITISREDLISRIEEYNRQLQIHEDALRKLQASPQPDAGEIRRLESTIEMNQELSEQARSFLKSQEEIAIEQEKIPSPYRLVAATPPAPEDYVSPEHALNLGLGTLAGLLAAALTVFLRRHPRPAA